MIYLDNAATSFPKAPGVPEAVAAQLAGMIGETTIGNKKELNNPSGMVTIVSGLSPVAAAISGVTVPSTSQESLRGKGSFSAMPSFSATEEYPPRFQS